MSEYEIKAYAKINLGLDVVRRLENGYHEVRMVMQSVNIYDTITVRKTDEGIRLTSDSDELPLDGNNLICRAASLMREHYGLAGGVNIHLCKNIPIAAGMAGGSTDAAAVMLAMNELFEIKASGEELMGLGVKIGADVPFCIMGGTALAEGIGEKLTRLSSAPRCHLLVAKPDIGVSTKYVYEHLDSEGIIAHPDIDGMVNAIGQGSLQGIIDRLGNVLENVTVQAYPVISRIKARMIDFGAKGSLMSGSGPTVFGIFTEYEKAAEAFEGMKEERQAGQIFLTEFV